MYEQEVTRSEPYLIMLIRRHKKCIICIQADFEGDARCMEGAHGAIPFALSWIQDPQISATANIKARCSTSRRSQLVSASR